MAQQWFTEADALLHEDELELPPDIQDTFRRTLLDPHKQQLYRRISMTRLAVRQEFERVVREQYHADTLLTLSNQEFIDKVLTKVPHPSIQSHITYSITQNQAFADKVEACISEAEAAVQNDVKSIEEPSCEEGE
jgi:hypothetical protein